MINAFEQRLADLLADRLGPAPEIDRVTRARDGLADPVAGAARVTVQVVGAQPSVEVGDDRLEKQSDGVSLRPVLRLSGAAQIEIVVAAATAETDQAAERSTLITALDRVLVALNDGNLRDGTAFDTGVDQGFALDGFRLEAMAPSTTVPDDFHRLVIRYAYSGRFWPLTPAVAGEKIRTLPTRMAVLPFLVTEGLRVVAGAADLAVPIAVDLRATAGAVPTLVARLRGASPPGQLIGDGTNLPSGSVGYAPDANHRYTIIYRPPASVSAPVQVRVAVELSSPTREIALLGELAILVTQS